METLMKEKSSYIHALKVNDLFLQKYNAVNVHMQLLR